MKGIRLGYLRLRQPATTLSGGEAQRLKICAEMINPASAPFNSPLWQGHRGVRSSKSEMNKGILYILDEPTVGLHFIDVKALLEVLKRLVDSGNTVLIIEHNLDVIKASDWIIDMGPEGGEQGGQIIFEGTPEDIINVRESYTGKYLKTLY